MVLDEMCLGACHYWGSPGYVVSRKHECSCPSVVPEERGRWIDGVTRGSVASSATITQRACETRPDNDERGQK